VLQEPYLNYYMQSHLKLKERWPELWNFVAAAAAHEQQKEKLEQSFTAELAFIAITRNDLDRARFFVNMYYQSFLSDWVKLHSFDFTGRHAKLQPLQKVIMCCVNIAVDASCAQVAELEEFLNFVADERNFSSLDAVQQLLSVWRNRYHSECTLL
jgi:hypothetical protein